MMQQRHCLNIFLNERSVSCCSTCVTVLPEDVQEDVGIGSASFHVSRENANDVFIHCKDMAYVIKTISQTIICHLAP